MPGEPVLVIAAEPQYYFFSGRYPPGPGLYLLPINHSAQKEQDLIRRIQTAEVKVIAAEDNAFTNQYAPLVVRYVQSRCQLVDQLPDLRLSLWSNCEP